VDGGKQILEELVKKVHKGRVFNVQEITLSRLKHCVWALNGYQMDMALEVGIIDHLPNVSTTDLEGLDKSGAF
jgi:hypothetical protein